MHAHFLDENRYIAIVMEIPKTEIGKFVLLKAEFSTGAIVNSDNSRYISTGHDYYQIFPVMTEVVEFVKKDILDFGSQFEYLIYDHEGNFIRVIRNTEE